MFLLICTAPARFDFCSFDVRTPTANLQLHEDRKRAPLTQIHATSNNVTTMHHKLDTTYNQPNRNAHISITTGRAFLQSYEALRKIPVNFLRPEGALFFFCCAENHSQRRAMGSVPHYSSGCLQSRPNQQKTHTHTFPEPFSKRNLPRHSSDQTHRLNATLW